MSRMDYGIVEFRNFGYEKRKTNYFARNVESTFLLMLGKHLFSGFSAKKTIKARKLMNHMWIEY
jgi:hypothetical protein